MLLWRLAIGISCIGLCALLSGCSSGPPPAPVTQSPSSSSATQLIDAGFQVQTATAFGVIESIDATNRKIVLKSADGATKSYRAGKDMANFAQLRVGDEVVATVTDACAIFLVKGSVVPGTMAAGVFARDPKGANPGGVALDTLDYNAKILDIDRENRHVVLQYGANQANVFNVGPSVNLDEVHVDDDVLVRATEAVAIAVEGNAKK